MTAATKQPKNGSLSGALCLYAQTLIGLALFLTRHSGTPGWISILLTLPFLALARFLAGRTRPGKACLWAALAAWMDGQLAFCALCLLCRRLLPHMNAWLLSGWIALFACVSLRRTALSVMARPLTYLLLFAFLLCAAGTLPQANAGSLFPLLGHGAESVFSGALWMCGCTSAACLPWLGGGGAEKPSVKPAVFLLLCGAAAALCCALLLPYPALEQDGGFSDLMLLFTRFSSFPTAWLLLTAAALLLLLYALCVSLAQAARLIAAARKTGPDRLTAAVLALFMIPAGACPTLAVRRALLTLAPYRAALILLALMALHRWGRKETHA